MEYVGGELELFKHAHNWKAYFGKLLRPYVRGRVLDVGCGIGANADHLCNGTIASYTFLEPDAGLLEEVAANVKSPALKNAERINGNTADLAGRQFDTILYIDVIEHIADAKSELQRAYDLLAPGGHLLILVPAFSFLFSEFDKAIGHHRRYDRSKLKNELPPELVPVAMHYLDSAGLLLSLGNKWFLKQRTPTLSQIRFWDDRVVPVSRIADRIVLHSFGRSLLCIARKP